MIEGIILYLGILGVAMWALLSKGSGIPTRLGAAVLIVLMVVGAVLFLTGARIVSN